MTSKLEALRGMEDILPGEIEHWQWLEEQARIFLESRFLKEIRTPVLEYTELFSRSVGESSDIVHKEMFSFEDRGGRNITLRPEMTASVARAVIEKGLLTQAKSLSFYYLGPMFRAERPQAGRKRQFHQIGVEIINEAGTAADYECVELLYDFLNHCGLKQLQLKINDLGTAETQKAAAKSLAEYFSSVQEKLCKDCQWRLTKNVLRIFDCKVPGCKPSIDQAPWDKIAPLSPSFNELLERLQGRGIPFKIDRRLVRGLDYYNGAVFECTAEGLGAQDAVAGGGRYDRLYADLGGSQVPCTGFSIGVERLLTALRAPGVNAATKSRKVYLAPLETSPEGKTKLKSIALLLRQSGFKLESLKNEISLSKHLKKANQTGCDFAIIIGPDEIKAERWTVKNLKSGEQVSISKEELIPYFKKVQSNQ